MRNPGGIADARSLHESTRHCGGQAWLAEVQALARWSDPLRAERALAATCLALQDQLDPRVALELGVQLQEPLQGLYSARWSADRPHRRARSLDGFLALVARGYQEEDVDRAARAVLWVLRSRLTSDLVRAIGLALEGQLCDLWPAQVVPLPAVAAP